MKLYASDYTTDEWSVTHSLPPAPPKHYHFPNAPEPDADESGTGHTSTVWASSFSPDGSYIASCSDDLSVKIWARYKRKDVKGEPGGAFRVGRTEKEGWYCALTISDLHERAIFSIDWAGAQNSRPSSRTEGMLDLGRIATVGGDGRLSVLGIVSSGFTLPFGLGLSVDIIPHRPLSLQKENAMGTKSSIPSSQASITPTGCTTSTASNGAAWGTAKLRSRIQNKVSVASRI